MKSCHDNARALFLLSSIRHKYNCLTGPFWCKITFFKVRHKSTLNAFLSGFLYLRTDQPSLKTEERRVVFQQGIFNLAFMNNCKWTWLFLTETCATEQSKRRKRKASGFFIHPVWRIGQLKIWEHVHVRMSLMVKHLPWKLVRYGVCFWCLSHVNRFVLEGRNSQVWQQVGAWQKCSEPNWHWSLPIMITQA